ncbi:MAG: hypothetical protein R3Y35_04100 [Clostridia bacterium]
MKFNFKYKEILQNKYSIRIITAIAIVAIISIIFADLTPETQYIETEVNEIDYAEYLEEKIFNMVKAITGESSPQIVITLNTSETYIYAQNIKTDVDGDKKESEEEYIIVEDSNGDEHAVLISEIEPEIKGVVVVSSYGDNAVVREKIINAVQTALDLSSNKVCVVSKSN